MPFFLERQGTKYHTLKLSNGENTQNHNHLFTPLSGYPLTSLNFASESLLECYVFCETQETTTLPSSGGSIFNTFQFPVHSHIMTSLPSSLWPH